MQAANRWPLPGLHCSQAASDRLSAWYLDRARIHPGVASPPHPGVPTRPLDLPRLRWRPEIVEMYQRLAADQWPPPFAVMEELRARHQAGMVHLQGDHIIRIADRPDLRLDLANLQTLCSRCHAAKTAREDGGFDLKQPVSV